MGYSFLLVYMPHNFFYLMPEIVNFILLLSFIVVHSEVMWSLSLWGSQSYFVSHLIYLGRCWAFAAARVFSSRGARASHCGGVSCRAPALGPEGSVAVTHRLSCPVAYGVFQD